MSAADRSAVTAGSGTGGSGGSLWHRAAHTPLRDWARGRLSGRLDWRGVIARAGLPGEVAGLVTRVVRRTRLWRIEKADVARELCAHFADGLAAGRTGEELMRDFGESKRAGRLIRRARKRGRPAAYRAFAHLLQVVGVLLLGVGVAYGVLAWRFFAGEPEITRNYAAEYNETIEQIPEEDRAWELYLRSNSMLERVPEELMRSWPAPAPEHPLYGEALAYLESQRDVLEVAHEAAALPRLGAPMRDALDPRIVEAENRRWPDGEVEVEEPSENPMMVGVLLPELGHMRDLARLLSFDAHVAARGGESARVVRDLTTMLGVARHAGDRPVIICGLVELAICHLASNTAAQIIHEYPALFTDAQLAELAHRFAASGTDGMRQQLAGERWIFEDMVQRSYSDDGEGGGTLTDEGLRNLMMFSSVSGDPRDIVSGPSALGPIAALVAADRAALMTKYEELMAQIERRAAAPMWEYDAQPRVSVETEALADDPIERVRYFPIVVLMPTLDRAAEQAEYYRQFRDGLVTGIALKLYKRGHGGYPDSLDRLVPGLLPELPRDRYTGDRLRYAVRDGGPVLWSVGVDRDDDGGVMPRMQSAETYHWMPREEIAGRLAGGRGGSAHDGDWVVWPVVYEPVRADPD